MTLPPGSRAQPPFALVDFARADEGEQGLLFRDPLRVLVAERVDEVAAVLDEAERAARAGYHAVGFVAYEAAPAFDPALTVRATTPLPLAWFGIFPAPAPAPELAFADAARDAADAPQWSADTSVAAHAEALGSIHDAIGRGDVYQVNHTLRLRAPFTGDPLALWQRMRDAQPSGYCAYLDVGAHCILSASPELFFERRGDTITTRPMKGTARRGRWLAEDDAAALALASSAKERAENVMIVDLLRNDVGRVARAGSVHVSSLFAVERHPTVLQMTSTVEAELAPRTTLRDIFAALFPCGSVTGAPKVAAMRKIAEFEPSPRGAYCGAIGHLAPSGDATFSVAIRTAWLDRGTGTIEYGVGGGITWDSAPSAEYDEIRAKSAIVTSAAPRFELLETMRLTADGYARRERHLARLAESARYFAIPVELSEVEHELDAHARAARDLPRRVRLLVARDGTPRIEDRPHVPDVPA
ncbi:MAG TPA: aminodeoxychorismate synthase component I, partial [Gemmatimonadaceae bacterium]|nr:aminodeoxychorismate synthase component I [Gemmatimonadaceae bacterium]